MGLLFRVQELCWAILSPWTDLLRVDVLNILGLSMVLMGVLCWATVKAAPLRPEFALLWRRFLWR